MPENDPIPTEPRHRPVQWGFWAGLLIIAGFLAFGLSVFPKALQQSVSFDQARRSERVIQVTGALVQGSDRYDAEAGELLFSLREDDSNDEITVVYSGVKPGNFNDAISISAIGKWDGGAIRAEKLLVKCPSKYQGQEVMEYGSDETA